MLAEECLNKTKPASNFCKTRLKFLQNPPQNFAEPASRKKNNGQGQYFSPLLDQRISVDNVVILPCEEKDAGNRKDASSASLIPNALFFAMVKKC